MPSPAGRLKAVMFRRKVYVGENHKDALDLAFKGFTANTYYNIVDKIADGKEQLLFGYAYPDGSSWELADNQEGRMLMYGIEKGYPA